MNELICILTYVLIIVIIIAIIIAFICRDHNNNSDVNANMDEISDILLQQSARWSIASENDTSPLISVLHANYAAGYLWAFKDIAGNYKPKNLGSGGIKEFEQHIKHIQDAATEKLIIVCPKYAGDVDKYLLNIAKG